MSCPFFPSMLVTVLLSDASGMLLSVGSASSPLINELFYADDALVVGSS